MEIWKESFGMTQEGHLVNRYFLKNTQGTVAAVTDFGATVLSMCLEGKDGKRRDVILGYDRISDYENQTQYLGATVGRFAGPLPYAKLQVGDTVYDLPKNSGENCMHGGIKGFSFRVWEGEILTDSVRFSLFSPHGEENFPGNLQVTVTYRLTEENGLHICYDAISDRDTVCNMTNHAYFNLEGHDAGSVLDHILWTPATHFSVDTPEGIPTGKLFSATGTPFDFSQAHTIGRDLHIAHPQLDSAFGYDRNGYLGNPGVWKTAAIVTAPVSGITMQVRTQQCGMQLYCPGWLLKDHPGKGGTVLEAYGAFCLETQHCPSPDEAERGQLYQILYAGEPYHMETVYQFTKE